MAMDRNAKSPIRFEKAIKTTFETASSETVPRKRSNDSNCFKKTEQILYAYPKLKRQLASFKDYVETVFHKRSKSVVKVIGGNPPVTDPDDRFLARYEQFEKTSADLAWIEQALILVQDEEDFPIIELRYFEHLNPDTHKAYTWEDIAEILDYTDDTQVRRRRNKLIREIALYLFGTEAIINA